MRRIWKHPSNHAEHLYLVFNIEYLANKLPGAFNFPVFRTKCITIIFLICCFFISHSHESKHLLSLHLRASRSFYKLFSLSHMQQRVLKFENYQLLINRTMANIVYVAIKKNSIKVLPLLILNILFHNNDINESDKKLTV